MLNPVLETLRAQIAASVEVETSAVQLIGGIGARVQSAVDTAIANGATAEQLAPITDEVAALNQSASALATAILANTPSAPTPTATPATPAPTSGDAAATQ